jgi:hypothetical protein
MLRRTYTIFIQKWNWCFFGQTPVLQPMDQGVTVNVKAHCLFGVLIATGLHYVRFRPNVYSGIRNVTTS